jgi:nucleoside-diphosphate-sugar epimerase
MRVLVSGANGFVGKALCEALVSRHTVYGTTRQAAGSLVPGVNKLQWDGSAAALEDMPPVDAVVHLAARVHVMRERAADPMEEFRSVNVDMTRNLARWAVACGAKRFVFMSSVKVNGEATPPGRAFSADDAPSPGDAYAVSKLEAEQALRAVCAESGMEFVMIRPPLVYGPGVRGNFGTMVRWIKRGIPLPLGAISNRRSLVALDNLVDFTAICLDHPAAANQVFLPADGEDVSTTGMLRKIAQAYGVGARLIPVPQRWLRYGAGVLGKSAMADRLLGSLRVDNAKARDMLGWCPAVTMDEQLRKMALDDDARS